MGEGYHKGGEVLQVSGQDLAARGRFYKGWGQDPAARIPGSREAGKPGSRSQILDFKGRGDIPKGYLNVTGWGEASKRQLDIPPVRTIRHGLYGASPFRTPAPNLLKFL